MPWWCQSSLQLQYYAMMMSVKLTVTVLRHDDVSQAYSYSVTPWWCQSSLQLQYYAMMMSVKLTVTVLRHDDVSQAYSYSITPWWCQSLCILSSYPFIQNPLSTKSSKSKWLFYFSLLPFILIYGCLTLLAQTQTTILSQSFLSPTSVRISTIQESRDSKLARFPTSKTRMAPWESR